MEHQKHSEDTLLAVRCVIVIIVIEAFPSKQKRKLVCPDGTHDLFTFKEQLVHDISQLVRDTLGDF